MLFHAIIENLNVNDITGFFVLLFFCTAHMVIGIGVGWVLAWLLKAKSNMKKLIMTAVAFEDTTAIPLVVVPVLKHDSITSSIHDFGKHAEEYVLIFTVFIIVYKWTVAYAMMEKDPIEASAIEMMDEPINTEKEVEPGKGGMWWKIKKIMNPPTYAALVAIPLALIPGIDKWVFHYVLKGNIYAAIAMLGGTAGPVIDVILGSNLSHGYPKEADIPWRNIIGIIIAKQVVMPIIGLGIIGGFYNLGWCDVTMAVMCMVIYSGPTSQQVFMICVDHKNQVDNASKMYFAMYLFTVIPMSIWIIIILFLFLG